MEESLIKLKLFTSTLLLVIAALIMLPEKTSALPAALFSGRGQEQGLTARGAIDAGLLYGMIQEYVYSHGKDLSRLDWEIKPVIYAGFSACLSYGNFSLAAGWWRGMNDKTGWIENFDWMNTDGVLTHYSKHDNFLERADFCDFNIFYENNHQGVYSVIYRAGFKASSVKMSAREGYIEYPPGSERVDLSGKGIIYEQKIRVPYGGLSVDIDINKKISLLISTNLSFFAWSTAVDNHLNRNLDFYDSIYLAPFLHAEVSLTCRINKNSAVNFGVAYSHFPETEGSSYSINNSTGYESPVYEDSAGTSLKAAQIKISAEYIIYR